jgi:uncharacterized membrane protein (DUF106 family)
MKGLLVAKIVYYILVFCWLLQISMQGYTRELLVPTVVLIVYGVWLNYKMRKTKK